LSSSGQDHDATLALGSTINVNERELEDQVAFFHRLAKLPTLAADDQPIKAMPNRDKSVLYEVFIDLPGTGEVRATTLLFAPYSHEIDTAAQRWLEHFAHIVERFPSARVRIEAHTDSVGTWDDNMRLSERRAATAREKLLALGFPADRLEAIGFGEQYPLAPNRFNEGRMANRRVEFRTFFPVNRRSLPTSVPARRDLTNGS
jgi:outer membrane protein OmpA-like peptidoglycan-associated protein